MHDNDVEVSLKWLVQLVAVVPTATQLCRLRRYTLTQGGWSVPSAHRFTQLCWNGTWRLGLQLKPWVARRRKDFLAEGQAAAAANYLDTKYRPKIGTTHHEALYTTICVSARPSAAFAQRSWTRSTSCVVDFRGFLGFHKDSGAPWQTSC